MDDELRHLTDELAAADNEKGLARNNRRIRNLIMRVGEKDPNLLLDLLFQELNWVRPSNRTLWVEEIYPGLVSCIQMYDWPSPALKKVLQHCAPIIHVRTTAGMRQLLSDELVKSAKDLADAASSKLTAVKN